MKIVLGSASAARKEILVGLLGLNIEIVESGYAEDLGKSLPPYEWVEQISIHKLQAVWNKIKSREVLPQMIVTADTTIVKDGKTYGKPKDKEDAYNSLLELSSGVHTCATAVSIGIIQNKEIITHSFLTKTELEMGPLTKDDIQRYVDSGEPFGKAGSYCIFGKGGLLFKKITGDFLNVWGFPMHDFIEYLSKIIN